MYNVLAQLPTASSAEFLSRHPGRSPIQIQATFSAKDHTRNTKRTVSQTIFLTKPENAVSSSPPIELADTVLSLLSPSGKRKAVLKETAEKKRFVEIWRGNTLEASKDVTNVHDAFYNDEQLSSLSFSSSESSIVYTAEAKPPKSNEDANYFDRFRYTPTFGEGYKGKRSPTTFVFTWNQEDEPDVHSIQTSLPSSDIHVLFGQVIFSNDPKVLYATGYEYTIEGRLLGLKHCLNRPSGIWQLTLSSSEERRYDAKKLTEPHLSARSPRLTPSGEELIWLANKSGGPHSSTSALQSLDTSSRSSEVKTLVDIPASPKPGEFPGLYPGVNLPRYPFLVEDRVVVHSQWGSRQTVLLVSLSKSQDVVELTPDSDGMLYSWTVLGTDGETRIICERSSLTIPHELVLGEVDGRNVEWTVLSKPRLDEDVQTMLSKLRGEIVPIPGNYPTESIVLHPANETGSTIPPCVMMPHGGPHGAVSTAFTTFTVCLALEGYTISMPNYTGSLGFGEQNVRALQGRCGSLDIEDCVASIRHLVRQGIAEEGPGKLFLSGGSHGGWITAHLIGKYPDMFTSAILRNPVISAGEIASTDIPDWYYAEMGYESDYALSSLPSPSPAPARFTSEMFDAMQKVSPIRSVNQVKADVLLLLGAEDQRVASTQGLGYYHGLKGRKEREGLLDILWFEGEGHALDGVEASKAVWECSRDWFAKKRDDTKKFT